MFPSTKFQRSIMPLIIANSIVCTGLLEYFIDRKLHVIGFIYVICCSIFYSALFFKHNDMIFEISAITQTKTLQFIAVYEFYGNTLLYGIALFAGVLRRKQIRLFIKQFEMCTKKIDELKVSRNYSAILRYQYISIVILIVLLLGIIITDFLWFTYIRKLVNSTLIFPYFFLDNYPYIVIMIIDFSFIFWIRFTKMKFGQLNNVLKNMLTSTNDIPQHKRVLRMKDNWEDDSLLSTIYYTYKTNENYIKLKKIKQIHLELIKCVKIINNIYGFQIMFSILASIVILITLTYNIYLLVFINGYKYLQTGTATVFYWELYHIAKIIAINTICEKTKKETIKTSEILFELYEPSTSQKFRDEIRDFTFQLVQNPLTFTASGFFDLDHAYIYNVFGLITTYLVILIQIGDQPKPFINFGNLNSSWSK